VLLAVALACVLAPATAGGHSARFADRVTITRNPDLHGRVMSRRAGCVKGRTVRIYRVQSGPDGLLDTTRAGGDGRWRYLSPSLTGDFYATIRRRTVTSARHRHVCLGDRSSPVRVQPQP
jgi:hypothetical protein